MCTYTEIPILYSCKYFATSFKNKFKYFAVFDGHVSYTHCSLFPSFRTSFTANLSFFSSLSQRSFSPICPDWLIYVITSNRTFKIKLHLLLHALFLDGIYKLRSDQPNTHRLNDIRDISLGNIYPANNPTSGKRCHNVILYVVTTYFCGLLST